jgi:putative DNA primase/helicase
MGLGQEFLGFKPKRALKIFYLQAEIGYHYLRERFNKLSLTDEEKALLADNLVVTDHFKMRLDDEGIKHIAEMILEHFPNGDVDIICIDPFYNVFDGGANNASENDNQAVFDFLQNKLCKLRDMINPKAGIILSHHTKKIDKKTLGSALINLGRR